MPSVIQRRNPNRGRPRRPVWPRLPLGVPLSFWCATTRTSLAKANRDIKASKLKAIQKTPGQPRKVPIEEYVRHGYAPTLAELARKFIELGYLRPLT
jgi:hypothetical protein